MNLRRLPVSIITRLLVLGFCLVLLATIVRYFALSSFLRADLGSVVEGQQLALANYVARDIDAKIAQRKALLEHLALALPRELLGKPAALAAWLKEHHEHQPLFSVGIFVLDRRGLPLGSHPALPERAKADYLDRDYLHAGLSGRPFVGRPVIGHARQEPILPIAVPIRNDSKDVLAVLVGITALAAPGFLDALLESRIGPSSGGFLLVSPRDNLFVAASQAALVLTQLPAPGRNTMHDKAMAGFRGAGLAVDATGREEIAAVASVPSADWFVVARLPVSEAFATVGRLQDFLFRNALLTLALFLALAGPGIYFVLRPLFRAADDADRMTRNELPLQPLAVVRNDEVGHLIGAFNRLLDKLRDHQAKLAHIAHHDVLTGLPNRSLFADRMAQALAQARRKKTHIGLLFMDLDGFKQINDRCGHDAGDEVLQQIARRLAKLVRQTDTLARVGGDEFVLVLGELGDGAADAACAVAGKCVDALHTPFVVAGEECAVGLSIGISIGDGTSEADALLLAADHAMYEAKQAGRGRYVLAANAATRRTSDPA